MQHPTNHPFSHMIMACFLLLTGSLYAQTNPAAQTLPYSQDFSGLAATSTTYPTGLQGWKISSAATTTVVTSAPTADQALVGNSSASNTAGGCHNYNGKLGILSSGSTNPAIALALETTGKSNIQVSYDIMVIRNPYDGTTNTRINTTTLQYRIGTTGTFTTLTGIEYSNGTTTQTGSGVTTPQNPQSKSITLPATCNNQPVVQIRWMMYDGTGVGSRPSFAVDNISVKYDNDGDGYAFDVDCNDANATIHPGAPENCNLVDDDCDGLIDEGTLATFYADADGDIYGNPAVTALACTAPSGYVGNSLDCNDTDPGINPGATEICNTVDDNCDGLTDDADPAIVGQPTWFEDVDGDTFGNGAVSVLACNMPVGYTSDPSDCDDTNAAINLAASEVCNGFDDNCDGLADDDDPGIIGQPTWYADADGDGFGDNTVTQLACIAPVGYIADNSDCNDTAILYADADGDSYGAGAPVACGVADNSDCNDGDADIHPGATEVCNAMDDDCAGGVDDGLPFVDYYTDNDNDTYGIPGSVSLDASSVVTTEGSVYVMNDGFMMEKAAQTFTPSITGDFNKIEFNINTISGGSMLVNFQLQTGDVPGGGTLLFSTGISISTTGWYTINIPSGISAIAGNVYNWQLIPSTVSSNNLTLWRSSGGPNPGLHPGGAWMIYDGMMDTYFPSDIDDLDFKEYVTTGAGAAVTSCSDPGFGYSTNALDCNDANGAVYPGAEEVCNGIDDNCNALADDGLTFTTYYADMDGDTYGDAFTTATSCGAVPFGYIADNTDCDDTQSTVHPGGIEICDGLDNDCDGDYDEGTVTAVITPSGTVATCKGTPLILTANAGEGLTYQWFKNGNVLIGATDITYAANKPGYYQVQVNVPAGCFALSDITTVNVSPSPNANISAPNGTTLCATVKLKASYDPTYTWQWKNGPTNVPGATAYLYYPSTAGSYTCVITNALGCTRSTAAINVTACKEGEIAQTAATEIFDLYPNPAANEFSVEMEVNSDATEAQIHLFNLVGEEIYSQTTGVNNGTIDAHITLNDAVPSGLYIVKVTVAEKEYTKQLVIQK